ncbi:Putative Zn-dependent protease [hydrothermal vent metagenome]|uniref:Zn-dependent protease n=1 Tax=hydrothermal vent metagenome TaxID=652676 RepID=A0A3B1BJV6_9ZZZZ
MPISVSSRLLALSLVACMAMNASVALAGASSLRVSEEELGRETDKQIVAQFGLYEDKKIQEYVRSVANKVLATIREPEFEYHFKVLNHEMVNAFALPGGYIYVTRGLLAMLDSEAALAGVIGHEIGHVIGHHATKQSKKSIGSLLLALGGLVASEDIRNNAAAWLTVTTTLSQQILLGYGRDMEMESDQVGMIASYEAGYSPEGIVAFLRSLRTNERLSGRGYHGFVATHPDTIIRIIEAQGKSEILEARGGKVKFYRDKYLDSINGIRYGKPKWRRKTLPPYVINIHTVKEGETFRSIAKNISGDEGMALEIAVLNSMDHNTPLIPGYRIKTLVPIKSTTAPLLKPGRSHAAEHHEQAKDKKENKKKGKK